MVEPVTSTMSLDTTMDSTETEFASTYQTSARITTMMMSDTLASVSTTVIDTTEQPYLSTTDVETTVATDSQTSMDTTTSPTNEPSMKPTISDELSSSTEIIVETISTIAEFDDGQCLVSDLVFEYFFNFNGIQRKCDICIYEDKTRRQERRCEMIENLIEGFVNDYGECMLNVCDYDCTADELQLNPKFNAGKESCRRGCNIFECGPQAANAFIHNIDGLTIVLMVALVIIFV